MITSECPGQRDPFRNNSRDDLLDRSLLTPEPFEYFVRPWFRKVRIAAKRDEWFEAFIYLWVTFNAWLAQIVSDRNFSDKDWYIVQAAGLDPTLEDRFNGLLEGDPEFLEWASTFHSLWPVFKVRALIENGVESWGAWNSEEDRSEYRARSLQLGLTRSEYSPRCFMDHQPAESIDWETAHHHVPLDWVHTISGIYQVRSNLFHGGKSFLSSKDPIFVELSFRILWHVWREFRSQETELA